MSFHCGTDPLPALQKALEMLAQTDYKQADVLMVSDFIMPSLPDPVRPRIDQQRQHNGMRFHSLIIAD